MNTYCLDASALVIYITSQKPSKEMQKIIQQIEKKESKGIISTVTITELHRALTRISSEDQADKYVSYTSKNPPFRSYQLTFRSHFKHPYKNRGMHQQKIPLIGEMHVV